MFSTVQHVLNHPYLLRLSQCRQWYRNWNGPKFPMLKRTYIFIKWTQTREARLSCSATVYAVSHTGGHPGRWEGQGRAACWGGGHTPSRCRLLSPCPKHRGWRVAGRDGVAEQEATGLSWSLRGWWEKTHRVGQWRLIEPVDFQVT